MIKRMLRSLFLFAMLSGFVLVGSSAALGAATIVIQNNDPAGVGFNDATAVSPVGGNPGTTLGQQRLNAFQAAANIWGATLTSSQTITVRAQWTALSCDANSAVLGSAGATNIFSDFANAPFAGTWYGVALANKLAGSDLNGANAEINANFNVNLGSANCLAGSPFYLGFDNNPGNGVDLMTVLLHELSHGLGFQTFTSASTGAFNGGLPSVFDRFLIDDTTNKTWVQMNDAERVASATNNGKLAWNGLQVTNAVPSVLTGAQALKVNSPAGITGNYAIGSAAFGPALFSPGVTGNLIQAADAADGAGPSTTDGCSAFTNAAAVNGNIAVIDRGTCAFVAKVKNAQNAGAIGVVVVNNVAGAPSGMSGVDATITIPSVMISQADGAGIGSHLIVGVNATIGIDNSTRSGADALGRALMFAPSSVQPGSSVSHWDTSAFPNQLMEPNINLDLTHSVKAPQDLTSSMLSDVGWAIAPATTTNVLFSASNYNVNEGGGSATVTVSRTGDTTGASTIDFATSNGSALQSQDYVLANGTLSFAAGDTSKTFSVLIIDDGFVESNETLNVTLSNPVGALLASPSTTTVTISDNDTAGAISPAPKRFAASLGGSQETPANGSLGRGYGLVLLNGAETSALVGLQFQNLGSAQTAAHLHGAGAPGVSAPILFPLPMTNPVINFTISPSAQQVADLKAGLQYENAHSTNFPSGEIRGQLLWNPTLEENFFVRQQYLDFLSRDPDPGGFNFWVSTITPCGADTQCFHDRTIAVADSFFFEAEFQQTAGFVFRIYRAAYGNSQPFPNSDPANPTEANKLVDYSVFVADRARVVGGANLSAAQLTFANLFVTRSAFTTRYGAGLNTGALFVDAVVANIQAADSVDLTSQRTTLINQYNSAGGGTAGRAQVMYLLSLDDPANNAITNQAFIDAEYNRQFALTLYFGYLRRNPEILGFIFWRDQINQAPVRDVAKQNALVCSFMTSGEYQLRFGPNIARTNGECPQ